jgi:hypothetical protein
LYLLLKDVRLDEYAIADYIHFVFVENARRYNVKDMLDAAEFDGVAGIGAALETGDYIVLGCEYINDFSLALVSPLETQQNIYFAHYIVI